MQRAITVCAAAMFVAGGCYRGHEPVDAGAIDARVRDAAPPPPRDGEPACAEGAACDDGDACTTGDVCRGGTCTGTPMVCDAPPGACFDGAGRCEAGECAYEPLADGTACDDGDPCTVGDVCGAGICAGTPLACDAPPPDECVDGRTLRTWSAVGACEAGSCTYAPLDRDCPDGCADGECRCVPTEWQVTVVDSRLRVDGGPTVDALAVDALGGVHVVYPVRAEGDTSHLLYYAHRPAGGEWTIETLARGWDGAIAVEPNGTPHVVYRDEAQERVLHATRAPGGAWNHVPITSEGGQGRIAVGQAGVVHVLLALRTPFDLTARLVHGVRAPSGAWSFDEVDDRVEQPLALALDGEGGVHVAYVVRDQGLYYARREGGAWARSPVEPMQVRARMDLAVDASGGLHLSYLGTSSSGGNEIRYASAPSGGASWTVESVGAGALHGVAMAMDRSGVIHAAHTPFDAVEHLARDRTGAWTASEVTPPLGPLPSTYGISLDLDGHGAVHLTFSSFYTLVHATRRFCP